MKELILRVFMALPLRSKTSSLVLLFVGIAGIFTSAAAYAPSGIRTVLNSTPTPTPVPSPITPKNWTAPIQLSPDGMFAWFPDIAADRTGRVHVVWSSTINGYDSVIYTSSLDAVQWNTLNDIEGIKTSGGSSEATRPGLLVNPNGSLDLTFRETSVFFSNAPGGTASSAQSWRVPVQISGKQVAYFSRLASDSKGWLHAVFTENVPVSNCPICYHLFYTRSQDAGLTWSSPVDISIRVLGVVKPQILVGPQDTLYVAWEAGIGGGYGQLSETYPTRVMYTFSNDHGEHWATPALVSDAGAQGKNVSLAIDRNGQLMFVWLDPDADVLDYRQLDPRANRWSPIESIPGIWGEWTVYASRLDSSSMALDSLGNLHLVLMGRTAENQKSVNVLHLAWDGQHWSSPDVIASYDGDMPEWPRIVIASGNQLNLVWFLRDKAHIWGGTDASPAMYTVWYAHGRVEAPAVSPSAYPTLAEITRQPPSATPVIQATLSTESTPATIQSASSPPQTSPNTESNLLLVIGKGLVPTLALILLVLIIKKIRGR
jgi:hypothetical protein